jgi:flagellar biosynthesis/type III secretory pathway protein FliH
MLREVRLFHARVTEAVEASVETLVGDIAAELLGRELLLAPADIERIVDRALHRFAAEEPLRVRVHPDDLSRLKCSLPVLADDALRPGDAILELRNGYVDASLGVRVEALLRAVTAA